MVINNKSKLDRDWIARHIPHQGSMCLLDGVEEWDAQHILCRATSHRAPDNPYALLLAAYPHMEAAESELSPLLPSVAIGIGAVSYTPTPAAVVSIKCRRSIINPPPLLW